MLSIALMFKRWEHVDSKQHYLFAASMPKQLQYLLLRLRTDRANLTLRHMCKNGVGGANGLLALPLACMVRLISVSVPTEQHLLFECPAYARLRSRVAICCVFLFTSDGACNTARHARAVLCMRENHGGGGEVVYSMCDDTAWRLHSRAVLVVAVTLVMLVTYCCCPTLVDPCMGQSTMPRWCGVGVEEQHASIHAFTHTCIPM